LKKIFLEGYLIKANLAKTEDAKEWVYQIAIAVFILREQSKLRVTSLSVATVVAGFFSGLNGGYRALFRG